MRMCTGCAVHLPVLTKCVIPPHSASIDVHAVECSPEVTCREPAAGAAAPGFESALEGSSWLGGKPGWVATPMPAAPTEPKLIPIVTTTSSVDPTELVQVYTHRWPEQENSLRDFLISLGLDTNHGYAKRPVENSEVAKSRVVLERKLAKAKQLADGARERMAKAQEHSRKTGQRTKEKLARLARLIEARRQLGSATRAA